MKVLSRRLVRRPSAATMMAFAALMISLQGTSFAQDGLRELSALISGKQIKDGSISARDLTPATRAQLNKASVPGPQGPQGLTGPQGVPGATGAQGPIGPAGLNGTSESAEQIRTKLGAASADNNGYLSSADWLVFNSRLSQVATANGGGLQGLGTADSPLALVDCPDGQLMKRAAGAWSCAADIDTDTDTNTTYTAAGALTMDGTTIRQSTAGCAFGYVWKFMGGSNWACQADSDTTYSAIPGAGIQLTGTSFGLQACSAGLILKSAAGQWFCQTDNNTTYQATSGGGVFINGTSIGLQSCSASQLLKSSGSSWACAADTSNPGTVTSVTAGSGLTGGTITSSGTVAVGDGAITAAHLGQYSLTFNDWANMCNANQYPRFTGAAWVCGNEHTAGAGLTLNGSAFTVTFGGPGMSTSVARADHNHGMRLSTSFSLVADLPSFGNVGSVTLTHDFGETNFTGHATVTATNTGGSASTLTCRIVHSGATDTALSQEMATTVAAGAKANLSLVGFGQTGDTNPRTYAVQCKTSAPLSLVGQFLAYTSD